MASFLHFLWKLNLLIWLLIWLPAMSAASTWTKCCPARNQRLNSEGHCRTRQGNNSLMGELWENSPLGKQTSQNELSETACESKTNESATYVLSYFTVTEHNDYLYLNKTDSLVHHREICLGETDSEDDVEYPTLMARFCRRGCQSKLCIRKCCLPGYVLDESDYTCRLSNESISSADVDFFELERHDATLTNVSFDADDVSLVGFNMMPRSLCPYGAYVLDPRIEPDQFFVLTNGYLYVPANYDADQLLEHFCIEKQVDEEASLLIAMVCLPPQVTESYDEELARSVFVPLQFVSAIFLFLTFLVYALLPELRNLHGLTIMCHVFALFMTYVGLGIIQTAGPLSPLVCSFFALSTHFFFLSAFSWMNTMSFDIWWAITQMRTTRHRSRRERPCSKFFKYSLYAWGVPFIIVTTGLILDSIHSLPNWVINPGFGVYKCWFKDLKRDPITQRPGLYYLYGPIALTVLGNIVLFSLTASFLCQAKGTVTSCVSKTRNRQRLRVVFNVFVLMGVTWIMEIVSWGVGGSAFYWMPSDIFNILQGVLIFVIFVCKRNVIALLCQRGEPLWNCWRAVCPTWCACHWLSKYYVSPDPSSSNPTVTTTSVSPYRKASCTVAQANAHVDENV